MCMAANFAEGDSTTQVDGVQRQKMSAVDNPSGGTYGINLQATQFCGPKAGIACKPADMRSSKPTRIDSKKAVKPARETKAESADPPNPDYPLGKTAAAIWIDTNIVVGNTNASAAGFAFFNITPPSSPFAALGARLFTRLVGVPVYTTGVSFFNITSPNQFAPVGPSDKSTLGVHAFADKTCANTVLIVANTDATEKLMDGPQDSPLWYLHRAQWVLTTSGGVVWLNGKPVGTGGTSQYGINIIHESKEMRGTQFTPICPIF